MDERSNNKLYTLLIILSIAIVVISAMFYTFVVSGTAGVKLLNIPTLPGDRTISVSGTASISVIPDTASMSIGVITQAATSKEASDRNAVSMNAVISALKNLGLPDKEIQTSSISIQPVYNYTRDVPVIVGYSASNNVLVTTKNLDRLSDIIDKSIASGANQVGGISFTVSEEKQKQIFGELLSAAVNDAKSKADDLAKSLNVKIASVKTSSINEGTQIFPVMATLAEKAATPIQPGESKVTLSVQVTYLIE
ncbi:MAG: SIMPL domain-containing protein [Candidatus Methanoperedens sp.]|nr:SIMPL domain-containing protein [Candidatus Methanoperedens sp.]